ncbi:DUF2642 domain-containing protein [Peribacillus sp. SCS-37]|uniref:DUF2642 domain-containing protein n=1 Tax=Paraperibacillus esterisolvens TaxID=3115296 RepID=UPI0039062814
MSIDLKNLIGKNIEIEISGGKLQKGILIDAGLDLIVLYKGEVNSFLYIPLIHVQRLKEANSKEETYYTPPSEQPIEMETISYRKILMNAKGLFVKIYVTGNKSIHGYLTNIMNDYFVFHSPAYKTMFISMNHVKYLIPYPPNTTPYSIENQYFPLNPTVSTTLSRSFSEQLKKFENQFVILDGGDNPEKIGLLKEVHGRQAVLITAEGDTIYRNLEHIKTIQFP